VLTLSRLKQVANPQWDAELAIGLGRSTESPALKVKKGRSCDPSSCKRPFDRRDSTTA